MPEELEKTEAKQRGPKAGKKQISTNELPKKTLEECIAVIKPIHEIYAGGSATWDEIAGAMNVGSKSPNTKYLIWGAQAYELIVKEGDKFHLSETGRKLLAPNYPEEKSEAAIKAVRIPTLPSKFYSDYDGKLIPDDEFLNNVLENRYSIPRDRVEEAKNIIISNAEYAGIILEHSGGKKTIRLDGALASATAHNFKENKKADVLDAGVKAAENEATEDVDVNQADISDVEKLCFYITPIGEDSSAERKHADMLLKHLVEPAFSQFGIQVVRADKIGRSGLISQQIFEHIVSSKFCVADLSFGNPNAFYELGVRHMTKLPTIQIIRKGDKIPFDVAQGRTIVIDVSDIYTLIDRMESAKNELIDHIKNYLNPSDNNRGEDNPISIYLPGLQVKLPSVGG
ncbi:Uncharacterised protein [Yersinia frederiksenii]|uniref:hypothetical protein n=1 Tax=Yersinia alsatica TaxID=2890317 RepID=UPI0005DE4AD3|nr:hypothetical protein [Yersinia alsatica]CFQ43247.1 Uncharacterised protein [Yersinia frederiksenii]CNI42033.1 Uncharacterised protein [Yersinia frederiksenii]